MSAAYGIEEAQGWPTLLQRKLKESGNSIEVINASISGETTSGGQNRLPAILKRYQPKWVILELGANDALRGQNLMTVRRNLKTMIERIQTQNARILLLGIRLPTNYGPAYDRAIQSMYTKLAEQYQLTFDPFFLETVALDPAYMQSDGLHPNAQAQPLILKRLWPKIESLISQ